MVAEVAIKELSQQKREIAHLYNDITKEIYGFGADQLKVDFKMGTISISAKHRRVHVLKMLEQVQPTLKQSIDKVIHDEFKRRFKHKLELEIGLSVHAMLRDYDPKSTWASTVAILKTL